MAQHQDALGQFRKLYQNLSQERDRIQARIAELDAALNLSSAAGVTSSATRSSFGRVSGEAVSKNGLGMREAIQQVTASSPLPVRQIVEAMQQIGFKFRSSNPVNSVGSYLYGKEGKKHFKRSDSGFSPLAGAGSLKSTPSIAKPAKRKMSAAGRRAIAEGARKRWAAHNAAKK